MKQYQPKEVKVKGYKCYLTKLGAMDATIIFGDLVKALSPILSLFASFDKELTPEMITNAFTAIDGLTLKIFTHKLLIDFENVMIEHDGETELLTESLLDSLFVGKVYGIFLLMFEVIKDNYGSFFEDSESPFGKVLAQLEKIADVAEKLTAMEDSMQTNGQA